MLYRTLQTTVSPVLRGLYGPVVTGLENVPRTGPAIIAANHISFADEFFTPISAQRQIIYFAKSEYFTTPGIRGRAMAAFFHGLGQVPVDRDDPRAAVKVIETGVEVLAQGKALGIYPEGTRSPDGRLHKFRTGVARLALRSGAPVVPVGIVGTREVQPPGSTRWHRASRGHVQLHFGPPLDFSGRAEQERSSRSLREVTEQIRAAVQHLSGQEYVDSFGSSVKSGE